MSDGVFPGLWIKVTIPGRGQIGPGKIELLRRIEAHQSIAAAARTMEMSYRRAWLLVQDMNGLFAEPVIEAWHGGRGQGGASLTAFGRQLIADYEKIVQRAHEANEDLLRAFADRLSVKRDQD